MTPRNDVILLRLSRHAKSDCFECAVAYALNLSIIIKQHLTPLRHALLLFYQLGHSGKFESGPCREVYFLPLGFGGVNYF